MSQIVDVDRPEFVIFPIQRSEGFSDATMDLAEFEFGLEAAIAERGVGVQCIPTPSSGVDRLSSV